MSFKPDYGLYLMNKGISRDVDHSFCDFRLYSLTVLGHGQYSTMVDLPFAGKLYALSLDFNQKQLEQILTKASPQLLSFIKEELSRDPFTPRTIDFVGEVVFGVRARLGQLQKVKKESFVPLVAQEIMIDDQSLSRMECEGVEQMSDFLGEVSDYIDPLVIVVSKEEVLDRNIQPALTLLNRLKESPEIAAKYKENVEIAFHGYDDNPFELFEIQPVREYVNLLDNEFPFWLFFLSKEYLGLQCIIHCFLPPFRNDKGKSEHYPQRIGQYLMDRWFPAMNHICEYVGCSEEEIEELTERAMRYIETGRFKDGDV